jgi:hypothetical protein
VSDQIGLLLKMLLPSVAISIAIHYLGTSFAPVPTPSIVLVAVFLPSSTLAIWLWWMGRSGERGAENPVLGFPQVEDFSKTAGGEETEDSGTM